jgi:hypothetical protein
VFARRAPYTAALIAESPAAPISRRRNPRGLMGRRSAAALPSGNNRNRGRTQASYAKCREHGVFLATVVEAFHNKPNAACELLR